MFLDEARLVEGLQHPNVCAVREHGLEGQNYFLVMEHVDGLSLRQLLDRRGGSGLPFPLACRIIAEVASALDYAHRAEDDKGRPLGLVHRDVSPANIMVSKDGAVKLVDFGLAKARTQLVKTQPGMVKGKFGYLAPEQLGGTIDWRTDIFALGLCLFEAVTGKKLFDEQSAAQTVRAIQQFTGPPPLAGRVAGVPPTLDAVLAKALAPDPANRFESAAAFRAALGQVVLESAPAAVSAEALATEVQRSMAAGASATPRLSADKLGGAAGEGLAAGGRRGPPWGIVAAAAVVFLLLVGVVAWIAT